MREIQHGWTTPPTPLKTDGPMSKELSALRLDNRVLKIVDLAWEIPPIPSNKAITWIQYFFFPQLFNPHHIPTRYMFQKKKNTHHLFLHGYVHWKHRVLPDRTGILLGVCSFKNINHRILPSCLSQPIQKKSEKINQYSLSPLGRCAIHIYTAICVWPVRWAFSINIFNSPHQTYTVVTASGDYILLLRTDAHLVDMTYDVGLRHLIDWFPINLNNFIHRRLQISFFWRRWTCG